MPRRYEKISDRVLIFLKETGNVWEKDMHHNNCMNKYISKFQRDVEKLLAVNF